MTLRETDDFQEGMETGGSGTVVLEKPVAHTTVVTPAQEAIAASGMDRKRLLQALLLESTGPEIAEATATSAIINILAVLKAMADAETVTVTQVSSYTQMCMNVDRHLLTLSNLWKKPTAEQASQLASWKQQYGDCRTRIKGKPVDRQGDVHVQEVM